MDQIESSISRASELPASPRPLRVLVEECGPVESPAKKEEKKKDAWDKGGVIGNILLGLTTACISALAAFYSHDSSQQINKFNQEQAELKNAEVLKGALDGLRLPVSDQSASASAQKVGGAPGDDARTEENAELSRIVIASRGEAALPVIRVLLSTDNARLQNHGAGIAADLCLARTDLRPRVLSDLIDYARSRNPWLRLGAYETFNKLDDETLSNHSQVLDVIESSFDPKNDNVNFQIALLLGRFAEVRSARVLLTLLQSKLPDRVRSRAVGSLTSISTNGSVRGAVAQEIKALNTDGWDAFSVDSFNELKGQIQ